MKAKILNALLIISSLFGYLEWGQNNHTFLFQAESDIFVKLFTEPESIIHPFTVLPLLGQILLLITLFQKTPGKWMTFAGMGGIAVLLVLMFLAGILGTNVKIILSTLPFLTTAFVVIRFHRKRSAQDQAAD